MKFSILVCVLIVSFSKLFGQSDTLQFIEKNQPFFLKTRGIYLGTSSSFTTLKLKDISQIGGLERSTFNLNFTPSVGVFFHKNFLIGLQFTYDLSKEIIDREIVISNGGNNNRELITEVTQNGSNSINLFMKYFVGKRMLKPFVGFQIGSGKETYLDYSLREGESRRYNTRNSYTTYQILGNAGLSYFVSNFISVDAFTTFGRIGVHQAYYNNYISGNVGLSLFFNNYPKKIKPKPRQDFKINNWTYYLGASSSIGLMSIIDPDERDNRGIIYTISPSFGVFALKNFLVGTAFQYEYQKWNQKRTVEFYENMKTSTIALFSRYYVGNKSLKPFIGAEYGVGKISANGTRANIHTGQKEVYRIPDRKITTIAISGGISYFINSKISLDGSLAYGKVSSKDITDKYIFGSNVGLSVYFGNNRIYQVKN